MESIIRSNSLNHLPYGLKRKVIVKSRFSPGDSVPYERVIFFYYYWPLDLVCLFSVVCSGLLREIYMVCSVLPAIPSVLVSAAPPGHPGWYILRSAI